MSSKYDGQVEVTIGTLIVNQKGEIFLIKSTKWGDRYALAGGHVEYGETIAQTAIREVKEETGFDIKPLYLVNIGTIVNDPSFIRPMHFVFIDVVCELKGGEMQLESREVMAGEWIDPQVALTLPLVTGTEVAIQNYINGIHFDIAEHTFV